MNNKYKHRFINVNVFFFMNCLHVWLCFSAFWLNKSVRNKIGNNYAIRQRVETDGGALWSTRQSINQLDRGWTLSFSLSRNLMTCVSFTGRYRNWHIFLLRGKTLRKLRFPLDQINKSTSSLLSQCFSKSVRGFVSSCSNKLEGIWTFNKY